MTDKPLCVFFGSGVDTVPYILTPKPSYGGIAISYKVLEKAHGKELAGTFLDQYKVYPHISEFYGPWNTFDIRYLLGTRSQIIEDLTEFVRDLKFQLYHDGKNFSDLFKDTIVEDHNNLSVICQLAAWALRRDWLREIEITLTNNQDYPHHPYDPRFSLTKGRQPDDKLWPAKVLSSFIRFS